MINAVLLVLGVLSTDADSVLKRGKPVPAAPTATIDAILANPASFPDTQVVVIDGMVVRSCTAMGCWMQLADGPDGKGVKVDFHDGGFRHSAGRRRHEGPRDGHGDGDGAQAG